MHGFIPSRWTAVFAAALLYLGLSGPTSAEEVAPEPQVKTAHIALILPAKAKAFAAAVEAVQLGAQEAERQFGDELTPKLRLYPTSERDDEALLAYQQALANGAVGVIGPLTRGAIAKLAEFGAPEIPVLALNSLDGLSSLPNLYSLGLSIEDEARQMARLMQADGSKKPLLITAEGGLARRIRDAFQAEWRKLNDAAPMELSVAGGKEDLSKLGAQVSALAPDALFLAADQRKARSVRPFLGASVPVYATSQVWGGKFGSVSVANNDLAGVRFVDMPWLLDPYHPDMQRFKHADKAFSPDLERLYALGLDAYRLSLLLMVAAPGANIELEGVSGALHLAETGQFQRELLRAEIGAPPRTAKPEPIPATDPASAPAPVVTTQPLN